MFYAITLFVFYAFAKNISVECRPASDKNFLVSLDKEYHGDNVGFRISSSHIDSAGSTTKFAILLKEKLAEEERKVTKRNNNIPQRRRRSGSMFFRLCVRFQHGRCLRRKRFGLWHKFQRDGSQI